jgi:hypothetical protein
VPHAAWPPVLLHARPVSRIYLPYGETGTAKIASKAVSPATIAAAEEAAAIEEAAAEFEVTATRWRYGDDQTCGASCRRCRALGGPISGGAEHSVRRDLAVFGFPKSQRRGGICRAFWLEAVAFGPAITGAPRKRLSGLPLSGPN